MISKNILLSVLMTIAIVGMLGVMSFWILSDNSNPIQEKVVIDDQANNSIGQADSPEEDKNMEDSKEDTLPVDNDVSKESIIEPDPECISGPCCDLNLREYYPSNYVCNNKIDTEYGCPWGNDGGDDCGVRYQDKYCSGKSVSCDGELKWRNWTLYESCSSDEKCQNGECTSLKCSDGTFYGECSDNKPKYCDNGNLTDKASLCGCSSSYKVSNDKCVINTSIDYKKIGIVYVSESSETYNVNWRNDLYPNKIKIENSLNELFQEKDEKFVVDFLGEYRADDLCWNPKKIAFVQEADWAPDSIEEGWYAQIPGSSLGYGSSDYTCLPNHREILWSDYDERYEEYDNSDFPDSRCFRIKCDQRNFTLSLQDLSWIDPFIDELESNDFDFSDYDYKIIVLGNAGPIIPQTGEKEEYFFNTAMTTGDIMGYASKIIVMTENGLRIPSYYQMTGATTSIKIFMPGWQQIIHEILHKIGTVDVYEPAFGQSDLYRDEALELESEDEVDKSIMANGWAGFCTSHSSTYSCTSDDVEKIYLDKYNRALIGLE